MEKTKTEKQFSEIYFLIKGILYMIIGFLGVILILQIINKFQS